MSGSNEERRLPDDRINAIFALKAEGKSNRAIAAQLGISAGSVSKYVTGKEFVDRAVAAEAELTTGNYVAGNADAEGSREPVVTTTCVAPGEAHEPALAPDVTGDMLRFGRWQDVLSDVVCDALIVDAPYGEHVHSAHNVATEDRLDRAGNLLNYKHWTPADVAEFVASWHPRTRGWMVSITDHLLAQSWASEMDRVGRYVFAPLPFVEPGARVRLLGDGPSSWTCWIVVSRPRTRSFMKWGALPGAYVLPPGHREKKLVVGAKPLWLMQSLVNHYSNPGDLVCDACAGSGTTLLAALKEGRRAVGSEGNAANFSIATQRLAAGYAPTLLPPSSSISSEPNYLI